MFESTAIALYLTDRFPKNGLGLLYGTPFAQLAQLLPKAPLLEQYVERIVTRPAYARALAKDAG